MQWESTDAEFQRGFDFWLSHSMWIKYPAALSQCSRDQERQIWWLQSSPYTLESWGHSEGEAECWISWFSLNRYVTVMDLMITNKLKYHEIQSRQAQEWYLWSCLYQHMCFHIKPKPDTLEHSSLVLCSQSLLSLCHGFIRKTDISDM